MTTPRKWFGELLNAMVGGNSNYSLMFQILFTIPLLFFVYKFLRPAIVKIIQYSGIKLLLLTAIPFLYYVIAYTTTVYSDLLYKSNVLVVGFLATGIAYVFYALIVTYFNEITKKFEMIDEQNVLKMQIHQSREIQNRLAMYNHDFRHHLNLIEDYIAKGNVTEASRYIAKINNNLHAISEKRYCDNETINSILSFYIQKAEQQNIIIKHSINIAGEVQLESADLCIIIANGLENAINATGKIQDSSQREIQISISTKNKKFCIEIINNYTGIIQFENDIPVTDLDNHGIGTKSIVAACRKYNGIYSFEAENNIFTLRIILNIL